MGHLPVFIKISLINPLIFFKLWKILLIMFYICIPCFKQFCYLRDTIFVSVSSFAFTLMLCDFTNTCKRTAPQIAKKNKTNINSIKIKWLPFLFCLIVPPYSLLCLYTQVRYCFPSSPVIVISYIWSSSFISNPFAGTICSPAFSLYEALPEPSILLKRHSPDKCMYNIFFRLPLLYESKPSYYEMFQ